MNLNEFLCKHFKEDENENVTIGDIFSSGIVTMAMTIMVLIICIRMVNVPNIIDMGLYQILNVFYSIFWSSVLITILVIISAYIVLEILKYISKISIAKCPLNK